MSEESQCHTVNEWALIQLIKTTEPQGAKWDNMKVKEGLNLLRANAEQCGSIISDLRRVLNDARIDPNEL